MPLKSKRLIWSKIPFMDACESIACLLNAIPRSKIKSHWDDQLKEEITACTDTMIGNSYVCDLKWWAENSTWGKFEKEEHDLQQIFKKSSRW